MRTTAVWISFPIPAIDRLDSGEARIGLELMRISSSYHLSAFAHPEEDSPRVAPSRYVAFGTHCHSTFGHVRLTMFLFSLIRSCPWVCLSRLLQTISTIHRFLSLSHPSSACADAMIEVSPLVLPFTPWARSLSPIRHCVFTAAVPRTVSKMYCTIAFR